MPEPPSPEIVLAEIPGWEAATYSELSGGLTNRTWLVETDGRRAVLKIDAEPRTSPYNSRLQEAQVQATAAGQGLANAVLHATETVYMTEYLDGVVWTKAALDDDENLVQLARTLRRTHSLPLTGRTFDAVSAARDYAQRIRADDTDMVQDCINIIEALPLPRNLCCCHNDLVVGNVIATPGIRFLDWEYACDNDPFFDIATIVAHHRMSEERAWFLLDAYFDGDGRRWREYLGMQVKFYNALLWLWLKSRARPLHR